MDEIQSINDSFLPETWPLMSSPVYPILILIFYWYFVFKLGPELMKNRPAFDITKTLIVYNAYQVIASSVCYIIILGLENPFEAVIHSICGGLKQNQREYINRYIWWYFLLKVTELLDTVFFVLRKKQSQVTVLHVYHHSIVMAFSWIYVRHLSDGHAIIIAFINSMVHAIMYSYYLISALGPKYKKYAQWKKFVTCSQLSQFVMGAGIVAYMLLANCEIPTVVIWFYVFNNFVFGYLFLDFYIKAYCNKPAVETVKSE